MTSPFGEENVLQLDVPTVQDFGQRLQIVSMIDEVVTSGDALSKYSHCDIVLVITASSQVPEGSITRYGVDKFGFLTTQVRQPVKTAHSYVHVSWMRTSIDEVPRDHLPVLQRALHDYLSL